MAPVEVCSPEYEELEELMTKYPDWKHEFPEIYEELLRSANSHGDQPLPRLQSGSYALPQTQYQRSFSPRRSLSLSHTDSNGNELLRKSWNGYDSNHKQLIGGPAYFKRSDRPFTWENEPFEGISVYQRDYTQTSNLHRGLRRTLVPIQANNWLTAHKFETRTTSKDQFKCWTGARPSQIIPERPTLAGDLIYYGKSSVPQTTSQETFCFKKGDKLERPSLMGNIKLEGDIDLNTTTKLSYCAPVFTERLGRVPPPNVSITLPKVPFGGETQTQRDFPGFYSGQPAPPTPITPAPPTIDLTYDGSRRLMTEHRRQYPGIDVAQYRIERRTYKSSRPVTLQPIIHKIQHEECEPEQNGSDVDMTRRFYRQTSTSSNSNGEFKYQTNGSALQRNGSSVWANQNTRSYGSSALQPINNGHERLLRHLDQNQAKVLLKSLRKRKRGEGASHMFPATNQGKCSVVSAYQQVESSSIALELYPDLKINWIKRGIV